MPQELIVAIDIVVKQFPNLLFALLAFAYLVRQNNASLEAMREITERQFELINRLCSKCLQESEDKN